MEKLSRKISAPDRSNQNAQLIVFALALGWGFNWVASRIILEWLPPWTMRTLGIGLGTATLFVIAGFGRIALAIPRRQLAHVLVASSFNVIVFNVCSAYAQILGTTSRAIVIAYSMPIWSAVLARVVLKEPLDRIRLLALGLCLVGILTLIFPEARDGFPIGALFALGCAWTWAGGTIYVKWADLNAAPLAVTAWQLLIGFLALAFGMWVAEGIPKVVVLPLPVYGWIAYNGLVGLGLSYLLWFLVVDRLPAITASLGTLLVPVIGVLASTIVIGERPSGIDIIGFGLIFAAAVCVLLQKQPEKRRPAIEVAE